MSLLARLTEVTAMRITAFHPTRAFFLPGQVGSVATRVSPASIGNTLRVTVWDLDRVVVQVQTAVTGEEQTVDFPLPRTPGRGYGVGIELLDPSGAVRARRHSAVDVQTSWMAVPRYGFLSEFGPGEMYDERADQLLARHITVVQFYDWMYRHYQYLPPADVFTDILGRNLALSSTRHALAAIHARGMAGMAYGSVYGAEPEYALDHPDELLYDAAGQAESLANLFYLQDVRSGPWRDHILGQYETAIREVGFNGIHADQYGDMGPAFDRGGKPVDMAAALAGIVGVAEAAARQAGGDGIIFNCVTNWPVEHVASESEAATYIEVWPPYIQLDDLGKLVTEARRLAPERQVILAAYMQSAAKDPARASAATLLTAATIHAHGGFHLLLGEGTGILVDAYYPKFVRPDARFQNRLMEQWDFIVRYTAYLFDQSLAPLSAQGIKAGRLWPIRRSGPGVETLSLINARSGDLWDVLKEEPPIRRQTRVEMPWAGPISRVLVARPEAPQAQSLPFEHTGGVLRFTVPAVREWTLVIMEK
ncbi:MAG TPA: glycoside hydrolase family 66 protein [Chloroflexota bacterium]